MKDSRKDNEILEELRTCGVPENVIEELRSRLEFLHTNLRFFRKEAMDRGYEPDYQKKVK